MRAHRQQRAAVNRFPQDTAAFERDGQVVNLYLYLAAAFVIGQALMGRA